MIYRKYVCFHCKNGQKHCFSNLWSLHPRRDWIVGEGCAKGGKEKRVFLRSAAVTYEGLLKVRVLKKVENWIAGSLRDVMNVLSSSWQGQIQ